MSDRSRTILAPAALLVALLAAWELAARWDVLADHEDVHRQFDVAAVGGGADLLDVAGELVSGDQDAAGEETKPG